MNEVIDLISTFGFPIFMTLWFMFITQKSMKELTDAVNKNTIMVEQLLREFKK